MCAAVPQISQHTQTAIAIGAAQLQGFARVMRNGERHDFKCAHRKRMAVACDMPFAICQAPFSELTGQCCASTHPDIHAGACGKCACMADMVGVFMRDEHRINIFQ